MVGGNFRLWPRDKRSWFGSYCNNNVPSNLEMHNKKDDQRHDFLKTSDISLEDDMYITVH